MKTKGTGEQIFAVRSLEEVRGWISDRLAPPVSIVLQFRPVEVALVGSEEAPR